MDTTEVNFCIHTWVHYCIVTNNVNKGIFYVDNVFVDFVDGLLEFQQPPKKTHSLPKKHYEKSVEVVQIDRCTIIHMK